MEKRTLGRTGLNVAVVGFGALPMGGFYGPVDDTVSMKALHAAIDAGMNFIDTSDAYGAGPVSYTHLTLPTILLV